MIHRIIALSINNKIIILALIAGWILWGVQSLRQLPLDAIPDITNNQVVIATQSPNLSAVEMEQFVTYPIEIAMANLQGKTNIRSVSQFGLSIVTIEFEEGTDIIKIRSMVSERLIKVKESIPKGYGSPEMLPVVTGLGEIYQYVLKPDNPLDTNFTLIKLRTIQDWVVKKQLLGIEGVAEVSSFGGHTKQYQVVVSKEALKATGITLADIFSAVEKSSNNTGASYIEKESQNYFIRGVGLVSNKEELGNTFVKMNGKIPVSLSQVATIKEGSGTRYGALTQGNTEAVGGIILMLKGANSLQVIEKVKERLEGINKTLPKGLKVVPFLDREELISRTIQTVSKNLLEGGIIVIFVLVLLLGNLRAGVIVASVIPLSMLFAISMMGLFGVSGNLMSLGAIDFGLIVDGAVIIVENCVHFLSRIRQKSKSETILNASTQMVQSSIFGQIIIMIVYLPLLALSGIEGKMFKPMALTVIFAMVGSIILSVTYVPVMSDLLLRFKKEHKLSLSDRFMNLITSLYLPFLKFVLRMRYPVIAGGIALLMISFFYFGKLGSEFIPQLDEGDYAVEVRMLPGTSIPQMIRSGELINERLAKAFPNEIKSCTGKIGTSEIPMDPMSMEEMDMILTMYDKENWKKCRTRREFENLLEKELSQIPGVFISIQQPIAMRFNELMTGAKTDVIVKILGNDLNKLLGIGVQIRKAIHDIPGATDISIAKAEGLPQLFITYKRENLLKYGVSVEEVSDLLQTAVAGKVAGVLYENNRRFDVVVKMELDSIRKLEDIQQLQITSGIGSQVPMEVLADFEIKSAPMAVFREEGERNLNVSLNVRGRDIQSVVADIRNAVDKKVKIPDGYRVTYGGQFENLINARKRLMLVVPVALLLILILLYVTFNSWKETFVIFTAVPLSMIGGIFALGLRDMPFSISAGVGFIALFGVAVLNGMVLISKFNELEKEGLDDVQEIILKGTAERLRPVFMTATVASLGFFPMAFSEGAGAEVQRPLATVVIGGLCSATFLTLVVLPAMFMIFSKKRNNGNQKMVKPEPMLPETLPDDNSLDASNVSLFEKYTGFLFSLFHKKMLLQVEEKIRKKKALVFYALSVFTFSLLYPQSQYTELDAIRLALKNHPGVFTAKKIIEQQEALKPTAYSLPFTEFSTATPDPLNNYYLNVEARQSFQNPKVYQQNERVMEQEIKVSEAEKSVLEFEIIQKTRWLYQYVLFFQAKKTFLKKQDSIFAPLLKIAEIEYKTGLINALEKMNIESRYAEIQLAYSLTEQEEKLGISALKSFIGIKDSLLILDKFQPLAPPEKPSFDSLPLLRLLAARKRLSTEQKIQKELQYLPSWNVSLLQQINPFQRFVIPVAGAGVSIPLLKKSQKPAIQAAQIEVEIAESRMENARFELEQTWTELHNEMLAASHLLSQIDKILIPQANQTIASAAKLSKLGEITALEHMILTKDAYKVYSERAEALYHYNTAIIKLMVFSGK